MNNSELKNLTQEELVAQERNTAEELWRLNFQHHTGQLTNTALLKSTKKRLARIKTHLSERAHGITAAPGGN